MLNLLGFSQATFAGGCEDEEVVQLSVDVGDVVRVDRRVKFEDVFEGHHRKLERRGHGEGCELLEEKWTVFVRWKVINLIK